MEYILWAATIFKCYHQVIKATFLCNMITLYSDSRYRVIMLHKKPS